MSSETVEALHAVTSELKACNDERDAWVADYDARFSAGNAIDYFPLSLTRAESEMIFTKRREVIEAKLKELGWSKTTRVEPSNGDAK